MLVYFLQHEGGLVTITLVNVEISYDAKCVPAFIIEFYNIKATYQSDITPDEMYIQQTRCYYLNKKANLAF